MKIKINLLKKKMTLQEKYKNIIKLNKIIGKKKKIMRQKIMKKLSQHKSLNSLRKWSNIK